jgi:hypothetical protein
MPVSSFRCTLTPSGISPSAITSSSPASRAAATSSAETGPITRIRAWENAARSSSASGTVATHSAPAPA